MPSLLQFTDSIWLASSWEYSFFAPHSMSNVVELMGGNDTFVNRTYGN